MFHHLKRLLATDFLHYSLTTLHLRHFVEVLHSGPDSSEPFLQIYTGQMPFLSPNPQCYSTGGKDAEQSMDVTTYTIQLVESLLLSSASVVECCWVNDVTANVQSWDDDANHSLLPATHNDIFSETSSTASEMCCQLESA